MSGEIDASWVRLELTSRPESARIVRSMSTAAGHALGFDSELLSDVNTAVTEACNNVILHAYPDGPGAMAVELRCRADSIEVRVCDQGCGIRTTAPDRDGLKVGLALMSAVADRAEFINAPDGGTEVRLSFRPSTGSPEISSTGGHRAANGAAAWQAELHSGLSGDVVLTVSPVALLGPILGRIGRALAPSAGFSLQRCYDVFVLSDALGAHAELAADSTAISVAMGARDRQLEFALAPLRSGMSAHLEQVDRAPATDVLAAMTEELAVVTRDGHETLRVSIRDHLRA
ncbi:MAG: ATP-binding protein [Solirubrobacterales bacterium]|nr:ATP-binding protein [Solirubrobacterales bacterium]